MKLQLLAASLTFSLTILLPVNALGNKPETSSNCPFVTQHKMLHKYHPNQPLRQVQNSDRYHRRDMANRYNKGGRVIRYLPGHNRFSTSILM